MSYDQIQDLIDQGRQFAADELGQPFDVYRMAVYGNGDLIQSSNKIASSINIFYRVAYGTLVRTSFESERQQGTVWYDIVADMSPFKVGDVFILNDPVYGAGSSSVPFNTSQFKGFALADHSPVKKAIGGRLDITAQFYRPSKMPDQQGRWQNVQKTGLPICFKSGVMQVGLANDTASKIPIGLIATGRSYGERLFDQVPSDPKHSSWMCYIPALAPFEFREGDKLVTADGARYLVVVPYTQFVGASGSQFFLEREVSQGG